MGLAEKSSIGIIGSGAMGTGIAQVMATAGHTACLYDVDNEALIRAKERIASILNRLVEKGRMTREESDAIFSRISYADGLHHFECCDMVIEAVVEDIDVKQNLFHHLEQVVKPECVLATNTSSLSIASIGKKLSRAGRLIGVHFFNPAPLMPLVEIIPSLVTDEQIAREVRAFVDNLGKVTVVAKDTPGFIVNKVARPFYSEALKMLEEGMAGIADIDRAMKNNGFRMGPFELMDLIGHDVNYTVTETVWTQMYFDPRYKPAITQKRLVESGLLGRKAGRGFYDYSEGAVNPEPVADDTLLNDIFQRILVMLINEAADTLYHGIATRDDIDLAMTKGVNYPKGLLRWADETGLANVLEQLHALFEWYGDDRYRPSVLLKQMVHDGKTFY